LDADAAPSPTPDDRGLREEPVASEVILEGRFLKARRDTVRLPDGVQTTREFIVHPGAVAVLPILDDGRILLERQYRYPLRRVMLEVPAGKLDPGEEPWSCGRRELQEETGYTAREWARAGEIHNAAAYSDEVIHLWFARGLTPGPARLDAEEFLELLPVTEAEFDQLAARGVITDVKTLIALQWLQRWRSCAWPLEWMACP
jgi:ADP-ribose pyrophosphatase